MDAEVLKQDRLEHEAAQDGQYPPCDFCGAIPDHHPWHGSGMFKGVDSPHIHACNGCRHLLPSRAAPAVPLSDDRKDLIREVFMRNGFTVKAGKDDLADYVYAAAYELLQTVPAAQEEPADNPQPAPDATQLVLTNPIRMYEISRLMTRLTAVLLITFYTSIALAGYLYFIGNKLALMVVVAVMLLRVYSNKVEAELYKEISQNE